MWLHLDVDTAEAFDALHEEWNGHGAQIVELASLRPWGMYEMRVQDPDGQTFRVSAPPRQPTVPDHTGDPATPDASAFT